MFRRRDTTHLLFLLLLTLFALHTLYRLSPTSPSSKPLKHSRLAQNHPFSHHNLFEYWSSRPPSVVIPGWALTKPSMSIGKGKRSFGCLRDQCRGLELEDLLDRGFKRGFRSALKNDSSGLYRTNLNYKHTILVLDTTQLNHMKLEAPGLFQKIWYSYGAGTYVVAFEGGDAMGGNKGFQLRTKDRFVRSFNGSFKCSYDSLKVQPVQFRLYVKSECDALVEAETNRPFILKPEAGSQGQGITFHASASEIFEKQPNFLPCKTRHGLDPSARYLAQEYISKPLLLKKCKFDMRVYMFVSSSAPYLIWYHTGYLRRSLTPYSPTSRDRKAYLTNTHFQSSRANFNMSEHIWTFDQMQATLIYQKQAGPSFISTILEPHVKEIARFVFEAAREKIVPRKGSSQIVGLDFMIDEQLGLHFLEANGYPGFTWSVNFDSRHMVQDMFDLMMEQAEAPGPFRFARDGDRFGGFHLVHTDVRPSFSYNPCIALGDNGMLTTAIKSSIEMLYDGRESATASDITNEHVKMPSRSSGNNADADHAAAYDKDDDDDEDAGVNSKEDVRESFSNPSNNAPDAAHAALLLLGMRCPSFVIPSFTLNDKSQCESFMDESSWGESNPVVLLVRSKSVLFPNKSSLLKSWGGCDCENLTRTRGVVAGLAQFQPLGPMKELSLPLERVAYPGGRFAFPRLFEALNDDAKSGGTKTLLDPRPNDPIKARADRIFTIFRTDPQVVFRLRWFVLVIKGYPWMAVSHEGFALSSRRTLCSSILKPSRTFETTIDGEHVESMEILQDVLALEGMTGLRYLSFVVEPTIRRVAETYMNALREMEPDDFPNFKRPLSQQVSSHRLMAFDFVIEKQSMKPRLLNVRQEDQVIPEDCENSPKRVDCMVWARLQKSREKLVHILNKAPMYFSRAKRGDAFESFRIVSTPFEEARCGVVPGTKELCNEIDDPFPAISDFRLAVDLENLKRKRMAAVIRDLKKRVFKKWSICRRKYKPDNKISCIKPILHERYRHIVRTERLLSEEQEWVADAVDGLLKAGNNIGSGDEVD